MTNPKILVCVDFDNTLVDCNSDIEIKSLANDGIIPEEIEELSKVQNGWIVYMNEIYKFLFKQNIAKEHYIHLLTHMPMVDGMKELLLQMYESGDCEIVILSDANSFFVQTFLHYHQLNGTISKLFTNPAEFDEDGCLQIRDFHSQSHCTRCPTSFCKGSVLENYVSKRISEGAQFFRILYIGDGLNDVCPALRLGVNDYVFARVGYRLLRSLEKMPAKDVKAAVVPWETGFDVRNILLSS